MRHRQSGGGWGCRAAVGLKHGVAHHAAHADHDQNDAKGGGAGKLEPALPGKDEGDAQPGHGQHQGRRGQGIPSQKKAAHIRGQCGQEQQPHRNLRQGSVEKPIQPPTETALGLFPAGFRGALAPLGAPGHRQAAYSQRSQQDMQITREQSGIARIQEAAVRLGKPPEPEIRAQHQGTGVAQQKGRQQKQQGRQDQGQLPPHRPDRFTAHVKPIIRHHGEYGDKHPPHGHE